MSLGKKIIFVKKDTYITVLELSKESVSAPYSGYDNSNALVQSAANGVQ